MMNMVMIERALTKMVLIKTDMTEKGLIMRGITVAV